MKKQFRLTQDGIDVLKAEVKSLTNRRVEIADAIRTAREQGDLSENAEYQSAKSDQERDEGRIAEIKHILLNSEVIKKPKAGGKIQLGSTVDLTSLHNGGKKKQFQVVGTVEADPLKGKISDESPLGKALLGQKVGDEVEIKTPAETSRYTIVSIS